MKCGPPQWMSEMCAIVKERLAAGMVEVYVGAAAAGLSEAVAILNTHGLRSA